MGFIFLVEALTIRVDQTRKSVSAGGPLWTGGADVVVADVGMFDSLVLQHTIGT